MVNVTPWATVDDVCGPCNHPEHDEATLMRMLGVASEWLYQLSGQRWPGEHTDTVRPDAVCTMWGGVCGCGGSSAVMLPGFPVTEVSSVTVYGEALEPTAFVLRDHRRLHRADGRRWPCCSEWTVAYKWGLGPPAAGVAAAAALGCELSLACQPGLPDKCRLPARVAAYTRQGVSSTTLDPASLFPGGLVGLDEVDGWLSALRYGDAHRRGSVTIPRAAHSRVGR